MTDPRPAPDPEESALLDHVLGALDAPEREALEARLAAEPALRRRREAIAALLEAERVTFEPRMPEGVWEQDAARVAAWVRAEAQAAEAASRHVRKASRRRDRQRAWARILAWSVGLHVVLLGVLAFVQRGSGAPETAEAPSFSVESAPHESEPDYANQEIALRWQEELAIADVGRLSENVLRAEQETLSYELPDEAGARSVRPARVFDHPVGVVVPMSRRKLPSLKKARLRLLGFNAQGTLRAVERGLRFLRGEQAKDGSFPAGGGRDRLANTSLALLAFLADGHASRHDAGDASGATVARGVRWLRATLFEERGRLKDVAGQSAGMAALALCEDYMLTYGWLSPAEVQRRTQEIATLAARVQASREEATTTVVAHWRTWALDAAARAGVIESTPADRHEFTAWVEAASVANGTLSDRDAFGALAVGTALLYQERRAEKPRFEAWSRTHADALIDRLSPIGKAKRGDPVGDTASILLALQVAYRTY